MGRYLKDNNKIINQDYPIPTYVINLSNRSDRKEGILKEFSGRDEFSVTIIEGIKDKIGTRGLWLSIKNILENLVDDPVPFILLCEDDHQFTINYSKKTI